MSKFNGVKATNVTLNHMGAKAFKRSAKEDLVFAVMTTFLSDSYYEKSEERMKRIKELIKANDPKFVANLALVARGEFHLRSVTTLLLGELARNHRGDSLVKDTIKRVVQRPDDLTELVAYLGKPLPNGVKKGVAESIRRFNSYTLAKYKGEGKKTKLVDLLNLTHPRPNTEYKDMKTAFRDLVKGNLKCEDTWEARLSSGENKATVWRDLIGEDKLGYMALLRNLRNIVKDADKETQKKAIAILMDPERVKKSQQLPFRFLSAYAALSKYKEESKGISFESDVNKVPAFLNAVEKALLVSTENIPLLAGKTAILTDNSGSMRGDWGGHSLVSAHSSRTTSDIANLFALLYWYRSEDTYVGLFGDELVQARLDRDKGVMENFTDMDLQARSCGSATETGLFLFFDQLLKEKTKVDRIIIFSDTQVGADCNWYDKGTRQGNDFNKLFQKYREFNPTVRVYNVDLKGYGDTMIAQGAINICGWSDKIFDFIEWNEKGDDIVSYIENYR